MRSRCRDAPLPKGEEICVECGRKDPEATERAMGEAFRMSAWTTRLPLEGIVIVHGEDGKMRDTWGRSITSGPEEWWPRDDPRWESRMAPEPCDDAMPVDGCRQRYGHMGVCTPTPEQARATGLG